MPRKTDSSHPADWVWIASEDLAMVQSAVRDEAGYSSCRGKLAEIVEKLLKAELLRLGWFLEKTHDLQKLRDLLASRGSDLADSTRDLCDTLASAYFSDRYPGFDLDDPDWDRLRQQMVEVQTLLATISGRVSQN